jgi:Leucine-rich repeat (LRR) protein
LTSLDNLPPNIKELYCFSNKLTSLDNLPPTLIKLDCDNNEITSLDNIPPTLTELNCNDNPLKYDFKYTLENIRNYKASGKLSS